jgi:hypothetical protein
MVLGSTQPLTEMSTRCISWGKGGRCVRLTTLPPSCAVVMKSGDLNFLELSGPLQACNGSAIALPLKVKQSHNRPGVAQRVPGVLGSQISWHSARKGGEVFSLTHRPPLSSGMFLVLIFTRGWIDTRAMVRSEGNMSLKNSVTPPGVDPGTDL